MLPPIVRRLFSSSPILAPLLLLLATATLLMGVASREWVGGAGVGGPVRAWRASNNKAVPPPVNSNDDRLPAEYVPYLGTSLPPALDAVPALAARLGAFLRRPVLTAEDALKANTEHCPLAITDSLANEGQVNEQREFWADVSVDEVRRRRAELVKFVAGRVAEGTQVLGEAGKRGIVLTAGNRDTTARLLTALRVLQRLEVNLPIEVFHYSDELKDEAQRKEIEELGAKIVEVHGVEKTKDAWKNFQIKAFAIIQSSFAEILYLDSDNLPLRNPSHLFTADSYLNRGEAAFWPDLAKDHPSNAVWRLVGETCSLNDWAFESGQIVINKAGNGGLNLAALHLAAGMMDEEARPFWFRLMDGDKDTFRWAFRILDLPYVAAPRWMSALGFLEADGTFCGHTTLQYDLVTPEGRSSPPPLFVHSNLLKHLGAWGRGGEKTPLFSHIKRMAIDASTDFSLNHADLFVRHGGMRNMCLDLRATAAEETTGGEGENRVVLVPVEEVPGNPLAGFEDMFRDAGGKVGGWDL